MSSNHTWQFGSLSAQKKHPIGLRSLVDLLVDSWLTGMKFAGRNALQLEQLPGSPKRFQQHFGSPSGIQQLVQAR